MSKQAKLRAWERAVIAELTVLRSALVQCGANCPTRNDVLRRFDRVDCLFARGCDELLEDAVFLEAS